MKATLISLLLLVFATTMKAQTAECFREIEDLAVATDDSDIHLLTKKLTTTYFTNEEKTRSIFRWITSHIDYDLPELHHLTHDYDKLNAMASDSSWAGQDSLYDLAVAKMVLRKRKGICDGYSRLFQVMCREAGVESKIITGFGRDFYTGPWVDFEDNHAWNAVKLDCQWYLLDCTWGAGYVDSGTSRYTRCLDDDYYLAPPRRFALNHYPTDTGLDALRYAARSARFCTRP